MKAKLNITADAFLLQRIKDYASDKGVSVSRIVEEYFFQLTDNEMKKESIFDFLKRTKSGNYPEDFDFKSAYYKHSEK